MTGPIWQHRPSNGSLEPNRDRSSRRSVIKSFCLDHRFVVEVRVCVIAPFGLHEDRGEAIHMREVLEEMARRSHSITYIGLGQRPSRSSSVREYAVPFPRIRRIWWPMFAVVSVLYGAFLDLAYGFDLFYFRDIVTPFFAEILLRAPFGKAVVIEVNGIFSEEIVRIGGLGRKISGLIRRFEKHVLRNVDLCVCVCEWLAREVITRGVDPSKVILMPNGVNPRAFDLDNSGSRAIEKYALASRKVIVFVGSFTGQHNVSLLINATKLVTERRSDVKLMLVGDGPTRKNLEALVKYQGIQHVVVFTGRVPHEKVPELLAASHVTVVPLTRTTTVQEMIPLKILEYWAMKKPVVTTRTGVDGIPEAHDGENVLIVEEDARSMAEGILSVLGDERLANKLGENGRKLIEERYNWENIVSQTLPILEEKLSAQGRLVG